MTTKKTADGFVWLIVTDSAKELFSSGALSLYELRDDDSEALISTYDELNERLEQGADIGISVGFLNDIIKQ